MSSPDRGELEAPAAGLLGLATTPANLYRAFEAVRAGDEEDGIPSRGLLAFAQDPAGNLDRLAREVVSGAYRPGPLVGVEIPKSRGGTRRLSIPPVRDRVVERAVYQIIEPILDPLFSPWSFAYRRGLGVRDAIEAVVRMREAGASWVTQIDFHECFDSLNRRLLLERLAIYADDPALLDLVSRLLRRSVRVGFRISPSRGAPQGAPLSPLLCNLLLHRFDEGMLATGFRSVRYADDVIVCTQDRERAFEALHHGRELAAEVGLELSEDKSNVTSFEQGFGFLGADFLGQRPPAAQPRRALPRKKALYVTEQGTSVRLKSGQVQVVKGRDVLLGVPSGHLDQLLLFGFIGLSSPLRTHALRQGLDVVFLSRRGEYLGRLDAPRRADTELKRTQYSRADDQAFRRKLARTIIAGKIANLRAMLMRHHRRRHAEKLAASISELEIARRECLGAEGETLPKLMGREGAASRTYFEGLRFLLSEELGFTRRRRRPPSDPVNSALSFGYSLLTQEAAGAISAAGFDPHVGFLHGRHRGRPSLALDLVEEFRPLIVDSLVVELFSRGVLTDEDFRRENRGRACLFKDDSRRRFLAAYEERQLTLFFYTPAGYRTTYRSAQFLQARQLANLVRSLLPEYRPVSWR